MAKRQSKPTPPQDSDPIKVGPDDIVVEPRADANDTPEAADGVEQNGHHRDNAAGSVLVTYDATVELGPTPPDGFQVIGHVVHRGTSPSFTEIAVLIEPQYDTKPGQFLGVWHGRRKRDSLTIIQVGNAYEVNPNEEPALAAGREALGLGRNYGQEGTSTRIYRLAECSTVEEFDVAQDSSTGKWVTAGEGRFPQMLARSGDPVVLLTDEIIIDTIGGEPDPAKGISLGTTADVSSAPVNMTPTAFQMHILVSGNPGKGKSYLAGNLIEEAHAWGIPTLVLDINGETIDAAKSLGGLVITLPNPQQFGIALSLITPQELVAITPNVQPGTQYAELIEIAHDQLRNESRGASISFEALRGRIEAVGESTKVGKASVGAAVARIMTLKNDPLIGGNFDFIEKLKKHRLVVLDCRYLSLNQTRLIAAMGARQLQRVGRQMSQAAADGDKEAENWFALYFVDEAHSVVPDDDRTVSTQVFYELARMGRHVRTGLILSSQSPQDLNSSVLKRLQTRFVFALERDQLRSIQGVLADLDERIVQQLPKLPRGVCAVSGTSEIVRHGFLLKVRESRTPRGGRTPPVFLKRAKKTTEAEAK